MGLEEEREETRTGTAGKEREGSLSRRGGRRCFFGDGGGGGGERGSVLRSGQIVKR